MNRIDFAIRMEKDGERYYREQAKLYAETPLQKIFRTLAEAEQQHAALFEQKKSGQNPIIPDNEGIIDRKNIFQGLSDYKHEFIDKPGQLEVYRLARDLEQKSIALYDAMLAEATDPDDKAMLMFIINQERDHFALFDELATLLNRPVEWVEDAEFGNREEY